MSPQMKKILDISRKAGELLNKLSMDPEMRSPKIKPDGSPVTLADLEVSRYLLQELQPLGYPVISEEALPAVAPAVGESYFLLDPLDGTKHFCRGEDEFAICVAFLQEGRPYGGAIYDPTAGQLYWAERGQGAFMDGQAIAHPGVVEGNLRAYSSGFHKHPEKDFIIESLGISTILEKGSALKFCDIAKGDVDLYMRFGPTSEWDTAAGQILLEEAGCVLLEAATLSTMTYGKANYLNRGVIACHASIEERLVSFLRHQSAQTSGYL